MGSQLYQLNRAAIEEAESVIAAVAYVTDFDSLISSCSKADKPLTLFARYDFSGPVSDSVLRWFLSMGSKSANYELRLVADIFHPKVIWWKNVGAYIGSANLSKSAWGGNVEAGVFMTEEELMENGLQNELTTFFEEVREISHPLTKELVDEMADAGAGAASQAIEKARREFDKHRQIPKQPALNSITKQPSISKKREAFLKEWADTLQILRDIGTRLDKAENLPNWMPQNCPAGVLADQFLHGFYYNEVKDGASYPYRAMFKENSGNREAAIKKAIEWWRTLPNAPSHEDLHAKVWAKRARELLTSESLKNITEDSFEELCLLVHAVREHSKRVSSTTLGLQQGMQNLSQDDRMKKFSRWLYGQRSPDGSTPAQVIHYVIHDGPKSDVPNRLFDACFGASKKVPHLGVSSLGEMVGWALPAEFPPRNGRTSKALTALGFNVTIHSE